MDSQAFKNTALQDALYNRMRKVIVIKDPKELDKGVVSKETIVDLPPEREQYKDSDQNKKGG